MRGRINELEKNQETSEPTKKQRCYGRQEQMEVENKGRRRRSRKKEEERVYKKKPKLYTDGKC